MDYDLLDLTRRKSCFSTHSQNLMKWNDNNHVTMISHPLESLGHWIDVVRKHHSTTKANADLTLQFRVPKCTQREERDFPTCRKKHLFRNSEHRIHNKLYPYKVKIDIISSTFRNSENSYTNTPVRVSVCEQFSSFLVWEWNAISSFFDGATWSRIIFKN